MANEGAFKIIKKLGEFFILCGVTCKLHMTLFIEKGVDVYGHARKLLVGHF